MRCQSSCVKCQVNCTNLPSSIRILRLISTARTTFLGKSTEFPAGDGEERPVRFRITWHEII